MFVEREMVPRIFLIKFFVAGHLKANVPMKDFSLLHFM